MVAAELVKALRPPTVGTASGEAGGLPDTFSADAPALLRECSSLRAGECVTFPAPLPRPMSTDPTPPDGHDPAALRETARRYEAEGNAVVAWILRKTADEVEAEQQAPDEPPADEPPADEPPAD